MKTQIQSDLPNFPSEVITTWIEPFAQTIGWPPCDNDHSLPTNDWKYILIKRPLQFWKALKWNKQEFHLSANSLSQKSLESVSSLVLGAVQNESNLFTISIPDYKERFEGIVKYLKLNFIFPTPPIVLKENSVYHILDGNHRMAAYLYGNGYFKVDLDNDLLANLYKNQSYWVAEL